MSVHQQIRESLLRDLNGQVFDEVTDLNSSLRLLAKWRCLLIQNTWIQREGLKIFTGPFAGMKFIDSSTEGCHCPKLIGCYEQPIAPVIEKIVNFQYVNVVNVGCAEGYYAVGLALRAHKSKIFAFDTNERAVETCMRVAQINGVSDRITVGGHFDKTQIPNFVDQSSVLIVDIEGAELDLLDPAVSPELESIDILVESHEVITRGLTEHLIKSFASTHEIEKFTDTGTRALYSMPEWFNNLNNLDQLLALWEWRSGPTPWLYMKSRRLHQGRTLKK